ncbi:polysaccharide pyruvyl transferase [Moritella sp. JT01]|uniref:polysaccharide pyruvyl transferase family protein n=1 Tax=Moritella sp. JT01 TaxID=756698 RepID=UPI000798FE3C|nr:polysaccharide pyruvyl transferase family protein [Moritella sp. JT01]KXO13732.1 polysaccharide pyruvyl transferase [Moritella sp. JT01]
MKVLITHGWSEENCGDYAIEKSIKEVIEDVSSENCTFNYWSMFDNKDPRLISQNTLKNKQGNVNVQGALLGTPPINFNIFGKVFYLLYKTSLSSFLLLYFLLQRIIFKKILHSPFSFVKNADLVIVKGGTFVYAPKGIRGFLFAYRIAIPILISYLHNKKIIVAPHSFGPFSGRLATKLLTFTLNRIDTIYCRETISMSVLSDIGVKSNIVYCPDIAFYQTNDNEVSILDTDNIVNDKKIKPLIGITVRPWSYMNSAESARIYKHYIREMSLIVKLGYVDYDFVFIPQVIGPDHREDDYIAIQDIFKDLDDNEKESVKVLERRLREPSELINIYSNLDLLIGTRMHSIIFAFISGVPSIAVSYLGPKHAGIMNEFGLSKYVTSIKDVDSKVVLTMISSILDNKKDLGNKIEITSKQLRKDIYNNFESVLKYLK